MKFYRKNRVTGVTTCGTFKMSMTKLPCMRHLIERVLEMEKMEEGPSIRDSSIEDREASDAELRALLESLQPRIRVYGVGGAGCNAVSLSLIHI